MKNYICFQKKRNNIDVVTIDETDVRQYISIPLCYASAGFIAREATMRGIHLIVHYFFFISLLVLLGGDTRVNVLRWKSNRLALREYYTYQLPHAAPPPLPVGFIGLNNILTATECDEKSNKQIILYTHSHTNVHIFISKHIYMVGI